MITQKNFCWPHSGYRFHIAAVGLAALLTGVVGCGGGGGHAAIPAPVTPVSVSVGANAATLPVNGTQTFTANVQNAANLAVAWSVQEGAAGGTITSGGVYTAPATPGTYHIVATSLQDSTKTAIITVVVTPPISVAISPATATVRQGATQTFTTSIKNTANTAVMWSVQEGATGGTITNAGVYTAPNVAGVYHVVAASQQDSSKTAVAVVTVPLNIAVAPSAFTLSVRQTQTFTAAIVGSSNKAVTWSVQEAGGGTVTSTGLYTAPSQAGVYHVVAQSVADPTQSATAAVTVQSASAVGTIQ